MGASRPLQADGYYNAVIATAFQLLPKALYKRFADTMSIPISTWNLGCKIFELGIQVDFARGIANWTFAISQEFIERLS